MIDILHITPGFQKRARKHAQAFVARLGRMTASELRQYLYDASGVAEVPCHVPSVTFNKQWHPTSAAVKIGKPKSEERPFTYTLPCLDPDFEASRIEALIYRQAVEDWVLARYGTDPLIRATNDDLKAVCDDAPAWFLEQDPEHWIHSDWMRRSVLGSLASAELKARENESNHQFLERLARIGATS